MTLRVVIDTNVRISALITPKGVCAGLIAAVRKAGHIQLISTIVLKELEDTLIEKFHWPATRIVSAMQATSSMTERVSPDTAVRVCRDPDDNQLLECALAGLADVVVTGDDDLLALHPFRGIRILTPRQFLSEFTIANPLR